MRAKPYGGPPMSSRAGQAGLRARLARKAQRPPHPILYIATLGDALRPTVMDDPTEQGRPYSAPHGAVFDQ